MSPSHVGVNVHFLISSVMAIRALEPFLSGALEFLVSLQISGVLVHSAAYVASVLEHLHID